MGIEGGNIVRKIGGESIKRAKESITLTANGGNLTFNARKKVTMVGRNGGVQYLNDYTPPPPLRVVKLDGPFDEKGQKVSSIKKGILYQYKIVNFNRQPKPHEVIRIKWATQFDEGEIISKYPQNNGKQEVKFWVPRDVKNSKFSVYAYLEKPCKDVSILSRLDDKFYYKGTKKWGQLQNDTAKVKAILDARNQVFRAKAGSSGVTSISHLEKLSEKQIQKLYEGNDYKGGYFGTRDVLKENTANIIVQNFYHGNGKKVSFGLNTEISKRLHHFKPFQDYFNNNYLQMIKFVLEDPNFDISTIDKRGIEKVFGPDHLKKFSLPNFSGVNYHPKELAADLYMRTYNEEGFEYYGLMGGTQTVKVDLEIEETQPGRFKIDTTMYIGDWYGSDWGDLNGGKNYEEIYSKLMNQFTDLGKTLMAQNLAIAAMSGRLNEMIGHKKGNMSCLNAFFWLQYHYGYLPGYEKKYKPFETELVYKSVDYLTINRRK